MSLAGLEFTPDSPLPGSLHLLAAQELDTTADQLAGYLSESLRSGSHLGATHYGRAFTVWFLSLTGKSEYEGIVGQLVSEYFPHDPMVRITPEFNRYAWAHLARLGRPWATQDLAEEPEYRKIPVTNWTLLRHTTDYLLGRTEATADARRVLRRWQQASGFIVDQPNVRSLQYHHFSASLVLELGLISQNKDLLAAARRALACSLQFLLSNGDAQYLGRGQQQIFGYGALVNLLASGFSDQPDPRLVLHLLRCLSLLRGFQREDGSFPLVLNRDEPREGQGRPTDPAYPGWYAYNNHLDYLSFLGVCLLRARDTLRGACFGAHAEVAAYRQSRDFSDGVSRVVRRPGYEAVVSKPSGGWRGRGPWTNDLPFPYVVAQGRRITPSFGGEEYEDSIYRADGIPLPLVEVDGLQRSMREGRCWSFWIGPFLFVVSTLGVLVRRFWFGSHELKIHDLHLGPRRMFAHHLLDVTARARTAQPVELGGGWTLKSSVSLVPDANSECYFWGGPLRRFRSTSAVRRCSAVLGCDAHPE